MHGSILPITIPPGHTPGDLQFCSHLVVYSPPPGTQKETIPHPRNCSSTRNTLFCVQNIDYDIDFHTIAKPDVLQCFDKNLNSFLEFLERKTLHV